MQQEKGQDSGEAAFPPENAASCPFAPANGAFRPPHAFSASIATSIQRGSFRFLRAFTLPDNRLQFVEPISSKGPDV